MLARAAGRKARRDTSQIPATFANQLALPWLCPALTRQNSQRRRLQTSSSTTLIPATTTTTPRTPSAACTHETLRQSSRRRPSLSSRPRSRALATTAEASPPPAYNPHQHWAKQAQFNHASRLVSWDASNPLMIHDSLAAIPAVRKTFGMGTDPIELHQNLYACLRVGRLDRGAAILKRLMSLYKSSTPEATDAHNTYLQALFESSQHDPSEDPAKTVDLWYNKEMIDAGVQPNAHTYVTLLRTVMHHLEDDARDHAVREYLSEARARAPELVEEINGSPDFTDEEWDLLIRLQPETYEEPPSVQEVQTLHVDSPTGRKNLINHGLVPTPAQPIRPIKQKGKGLDSLKQALAMFNDTESVPFPHDMEGTQEEKDQAYAYARQLHLERDSLKAAVERWKFENEKLQEIGIHGVLKTKSVQAYMYHWYSALVPLFRKQIEHARNILSAPAMENSRDDAQAYGAWLEKCTPETLAAMTVARCVQSSIRDSREDSISMKISALSTTLGQDIEDYLKAEATNRLNTFLKKQRKLTRRHLITKLSKIDTTPGTSPSSIRSTPLSADNIDIPLIVRTKLGAMCLELLLQSATITMTVNDAKTGKQVSHTTAAFSHQIGFFQGKKVGVLTPHHEVVRKLCTETVQDVSTVKLPMVVEPKAWAGFDEGAYYTTPSKVVRQKTPDISQRMYTHSAIENGDMNQVLAGLDVLGKVPWQINASLLEVMTQIWNSGDGVGALVGEKLSIERPSEPPADATFEQRFKWSKQLKEYENAKSGLHSQRCFVNSQLETARSFVNEKKIFFPHSVDFRGRAYPIPPILNHIGSDLARGLLQFANGKELGTVGLQWLKIHIANLYGFDKASLKEREQFAVDNMDEILDSASNPVEGRRWWTKAEDPWQCLACCMELGKAFSLPDPTRHVSQLPVHQDGTCNGLQHYAALGGDFAGARQVNLEPSDRPQDIYTGVAELVKEMVSTDAAKGNKIAALVDGYITRKVVKRTVMTNVYGVTFMGAKQQVLDELHNTFPNFQGTKDVPYLPSVALYVATKIFQALGKIFNGAQEIQYWLGECGDRITTSISAEQVKQIRKRFEGKKIDVYGGIYNDSRMSKTLQTKLLKGIETFRTSIIWTTPLKMPIVQPYRKDSTQKVKTKIQDITIMKKSNSDVVDKRKQLQAFPPNFIHSLDASHMILSALKCNELGLDFAAVHDSFWTHASDIPTLNTILRDAFVRMHSEDIVGRLHAEFTARYSGAMYRANVFTTSKAGLAICEWRRQQRRLSEKTPGSVVRSSTANWEEVALEAERQELLASEDVDARKKGEEMVTPTSIWMAYQDPKALYSTRMNLLGESRGKKRQDEVRDKVLSAEAEAMGAATCNAEPVPAVPTGEGMNDSKRVTPDTADELPRVHGKAATIDVWVPLTFPPVPEKGGWDVSRLRESKYFFS